MTRYRISTTVLAVCIAVAVGAGFASSKTTSSDSTATLAPAMNLQNAFVSVYKHVSPSVVQIETTEGLGSGIVLDSKGDIVTNDHVVGTATTFKVTTSSGTRLTGKLVGTFKLDDLAVIKVSGAGLNPATFANSDNLHIGDIAMAIGNPLGLQSSFTEGIVSQLNKSESEGNGVVLPNAIQTSAAINPGNSGGALVNLDGSVIGIPTLAAADPQLGGAAVGIGFAIPSNVVKSIATQLVEKGKVTNSDRAYLGVEVADTSSANGVYVSKILAGTGASSSGLKVGDRITSVNGSPTPTSTELRTVLAGLKPGQTVKLAVTHQGGSTGTIELKLGQYPAGSS
ncbi:MAG TPA: trypsin-like peptidase domain-containing protein [Gaiellaceae bacterium]|jgi:S1-C subfamily serine protease|nr:trypsin-like peptidase domain-containing protein [Gaiellaceae bacterium]